MNADELEQFEADVIEAIEDAGEEVEYRRRRDDRQVDTFEFGQMVTSQLSKLGYRKPRIVTTVEELDALPFDSVVFLTQERPESQWGPYRDVFRKGAVAWIGINKRLGESAQSLIGYGGELLLIHAPEGDPS